MKDGQDYEETLSPLAKITTPAARPMPCSRPVQAGLSFRV